MVSLFNISLYTTSQICMQCLTDLILLLGAVESISKNPQSALLYRYLWQSFESDYPGVEFLRPCQIQNLWTPHCLRLWSLPILNVSLFVIWATLFYKSSAMLGGLQWMWARSGLLLGMILDMRLHGDSIYTAELWRPATLASYGLFVIKCFAIHLTMGPAEWGNTCWKKLTSQR